VKHEWMRRVGIFFARWPFMCLAILTIGGFIFAETDNLPPALLGLLRVLIVPMWLVRMLQVMVGIGSLPNPIQLVIALPLYLLPYAIADWLLWRLRQRTSSHQAAAV
jgi:hypothetical protein